jgi:pimeloyl-ACP methyl ester carboxylesterase
VSFGSSYSATGQGSALRFSKKPALISSGLVMGVLLFSLGLAALPAAKAAGRVPVIIIPGIAGSTFKTGPGYTFIEGDNGHGGGYQHTYGSNETVWVNVWEAALPGSDDYFDTIKLQPDGNTPYIPYSNLAVSGIYSDAYNDLTDFLHRQGYVDNVTLFTFPYDWRRDIPTATYNQLDALVERAKASAASGQVDLIGHSMGGLVARNYISASPATAAKVRRVITFGTPYLGAPKFLKALLYGDQFGPSFLGLGLDPNEVKDLVQNMGGGWQLLPSRSYYSFYNNAAQSLLSPYREDRDVDGNGTASGAFDYTGLSGFLRNLGKNQNAASLGQIFHDRLDTSWPTGPKLSFINGSGLATPGQVRDYTGSCWSWFHYVPCPKTDVLNLDGDGTVPFYSASPYDGSRGLNLSGEAAIHIVNREHGALVQYDRTLGFYTGDGPSLTLLGQILNNTVDPIGGSAAKSPASWDSLTRSENDLTAARTPARRPARLTLSGYSLVATDNVRLEVNDARGRHTGKLAGADQKYEQGIEGSNLDTIDGSQLLYLPASGQYTLRLTAQTGGIFDLKIRYLDQDNIRQTAVYLNVPVQAGEQAEFELNGWREAKSAPELRFSQDYNPAEKGDSLKRGRVVKASAVLDASASNDQAAPLISLSQPAKLSNGETLLSWKTQDGLSGLQLEQGILDGGTAGEQLVQSGQHLKLAPGPHRLEVLAQDRAGNTAYKELKFELS